MSDALRFLLKADGSSRAVLRDGTRLTLADVDDAGVATPLFRAAEAQRLVTFAEHAAVGTPAATQHPSAIPMLATLCLALVALLDNPTNERLFP